MAETAQASENPFWTFTLGVYGRDGVSPALIGLQDRLGLDVNFLLMALYAGSRGRALSVDEFRTLETTVAPWRRAVIHPLRAARRWLKEQRLLPPEAADPLRKGVLAQEIQSEGLQQQLMAATIAIPEGTADPALAARNLAHCLAAAGARPEAADRSALATVLEKVMGVTPEAAQALLREAGLAAA